MDFFYKPPLQRDDECTALDQNYMSCLLQKAINDRVSVNRCHMSNILWFNLECPKWINKYDDPIKFKRRVKDFFDDQYFRKMSTETEGPRHLYSTKETLGDRPGTIRYPEDTHKHPVFDEFYKRNEEQLSVERPQIIGLERPETEVPDEHNPKTYSNFEVKAAEVEGIKTHAYWQQYVDDYREKYAEDIQKRQAYLSGDAPEVSFIVS
jgi:hypothetical protein